MFLTLDADKSTIISSRDTTPNDECSHCNTGDESFYGVISSRRLDIERKIKTNNKQRTATRRIIVHKFKRRHKSL